MHMFIVSNSHMLSSMASLPSSPEPEKLRLGFYRTSSHVCNKKERGENLKPKPCVTRTGLYAKLNVAATKGNVSEADLPQTPENVCKTGAFEDLKSWE